MIDKVLDSAFSYAQKGANFLDFKKEPVLDTPFAPDISVSEPRHTTVSSPVLNKLLHNTDVTIADVKTRIEFVLKTALEAINNHDYVDDVSNACISLSKKLISHSTMLKQEPSTSTLNVNASIIQLLDHVSPLLIKLSENLDLLTHQERQKGELAAKAVRSIIDHIRLPFTTTSTCAASTLSVFSITPILNSLNPLSWADYLLLLLASVDGSHGVSSFLKSSGIIHLLLSAYHGVFFILAVFGFLSTFRAMDKAITGSRLEGLLLFLWSVLEAIFWRYELHLGNIDVKKESCDVKTKKGLKSASVDGIHAHAPDINNAEQPNKSIAGPLHKPYYNSIPSDDNKTK
jgi:hypothetical protein